MSTSFLQFEYCCLCKLNHNKRKKHIYSKRHQETLTNILKKFKSKISTCLSSLDSSEVFDRGFETGAKFWCYFCEEEFSKHTLFEDCTVKNGGFLTHLSSADHLAKTDKFFWNNLIDKKKKPEFILKQEDFEKFLRSQDVAVENFRQILMAKRLQESDKICRQEYKRRWIEANRRRMSSKTSAQEQTVRFKRPRSALSDPGTRGKATVAAFGDGLAFVTHKEVDGKEGNVYSDAVPPWLKDDVDVSKKDEIGPSMDEYEKELKREKKRKLPATRVGAQFDRNTKSELDWLPSFGRVWNQGRRLHSKNQFQRNMRRGLNSSSESHYQGSQNYRSHNRVSNNTQTGAHESNQTLTHAGSSATRSGHIASADRQWESPFSAGGGMTNHSEPYRSLGSGESNWESPFSSGGGTSNFSESSQSLGSGDSNRESPLSASGGFSSSDPSAVTPGGFVPYRRRGPRVESNGSVTVPRYIPTPVLRTPVGPTTNVNGLSRVHSHLDDNFKT